MGHNDIGFPINSDPDPLKITKLPSQHLTVGHHQHLNGVFLAGRSWPAYWYLDSISSH